MNSSIRRIGRCNPIASISANLKRRQLQPATHPRYHSYRTMPTHSSTTESTTDTKPSSDSNHASLPLPAPDGAAVTLDVSGEGITVKLDHLGPVVVNVDGTLSRIANWEHMTEIERTKTLIVLGKRNKERMEALKRTGANNEDVETGVGRAGKEE